MRSEGEKGKRGSRGYQPQQEGRKDGRLAVISAYTHTRQIKDGLSSAATSHHQGFGLSLWRRNMLCTFRIDDTQQLLSTTDRLAHAAYVFTYSASPPRPLGRSTLIQSVQQSQTIRQEH